MPDRLIPILSLSCGTLTTLYVGLMVTTIFFASWQSEAMNSVRTTESQIGNLESQYYTAMNKVTNENPETLGFVTPAHVAYVAESQDASADLSFVGH
jgi:hypothetical protein